MNALLLPLLAKALTTALVVVSASVAAEALGAFWGALIASLPVSAGPAYVFLAMQHDVAFVAASALGSCAANAATGVFLVAYRLLAERTRAWQGFGAAVVAWLAVGGAVQCVAWTPVSVSLLNLAVFGVGLRLVRSRGEVGLVGSRGRVERGAPRAARRRWFDLVLRAAAVAAFVALVVTASTRLGPAATGIAAVFPVSLISLLAILRQRLGSTASARVAAEALAPMLGFGAMLLVVALAVPLLGAAAGLGAGLAVSLLWSGLLLWRAARRR